MLGRGAIMPAVCVGVAFFGMASNDVVEITKMEASGKGAWRPAGQSSSGPGALVRRRRGHVLVLGGAVNSGRRVVLEPFLRALCGPEVMTVTTVHDRYSSV